MKIQTSAPLYNHIECGSGLEECKVVDQTHYPRPRSSGRAGGNPMEFSDVRRRGTLNTMPPIQQNPM